MNFIEYYKTIANKQTKQSLRNRIVEATGIHIMTYYTWLRRGKIPSQYHNAIAEITNLKKSELFPETN